MLRSRCLPKTRSRNNYGFELLEGSAVFDLGVLGLVEEGSSESSDDGLGVSTLDGKD